MYIYSVAAVFLQETDVGDHVGRYFEKDDYFSNNKQFNMRFLFIFFTYNNIGSQV
jgi:hypothetical protein